MDERRTERYTAEDVLRATEPVVAPVAPGSDLRAGNDLGTSRNDMRSRRDGMDTLRGDARGNDIRYAEPPTTATGRTLDNRVDEGPMGRDMDVRSTERDVDRPIGATTAARPVDEPVGGERDRVVATDEPRRGYDVLATFLGWCIAAFFTLLLFGIAAALLGSSAYGTANDATGITAGDARNLTTAGFVGLLVSQFLAYLIGGIGAGKMARFRGVAHGLGVAVWGVLMAILLGVAGATLGDAYNLGAYVPRFDWNALTGPAILGIVLTLAAMFLGAILGGLLGARPYERGAYETRERRGVYRRGRPL